MSTLPFQADANCHKEGKERFDADAVCDCEDGALPFDPERQDCPSSVRSRSNRAVEDPRDESKVYPVPSESPKVGAKANLCGKITKVAQRCYQDLRTNETGREPKAAEDWIMAFIPACKWLRSYRWKSTLWRDVVAGLTVGIMVIPQGMSYAKLAGLPVQYGLYSALVPLYVYAVFGSSRHLSVGPVAITSLLLSTGLTKVMEARGVSEDDETYESQYVQLAIQTSFLVGVLYLAMTIFRLGFITMFLSHAVISGFTSGAAIVRV
jgi:hypothetical protein